MPGKTKHSLLPKITYEEIYRGGFLFAACPVYDKNCELSCEIRDIVQAENYCQTSNELIK